MPKIKLSDGTYIKYTTIPLYRGVKIIDKEKSLTNLILLKQILDKHKVKFQLAYGTLLGAIRDKDFISHDEDIDLIILEEDKNMFMNTLSILIENGFRIARYDRRGLLSIIRNGEYIDLYFFDKLDDEIRTCSGMLCPATFLENVSLIDFKGENFYAPTDYVGFFEYEYGDDWMTPIKWANFEPSYFHVLKMNLRMKIRDILPDWIFFKLAKGAEKKLEARYAPKMKRYKERKQNNEI